MRHIPALDGIRALAVLAVVLAHSRVPGFGGGFIGVDVFFVLSGYLITQVLQENPDLRRFYWRRFMRLVPALALMLAVYVALAPLVWRGQPHGRDALLAFFYLSDYTRGLMSQPQYLGHTWSLSVEEHFYLLWPLIFLRWKPSVMALALAFELLTLWGWANAGLPSAYFRFDTHCTGLILGCLIALMPHKAAPAWPGLVMLALLVVWMPADYLGATVGRTLVEVAAAVAIVGTPPQWLGRPALAYLGKLSYGIYLWHYPITRMAKDWHWGWPQSALVTLLASVALAALSYHTIEAMTRNRKRASLESRLETG